MARRKQEEETIMEVESTTGATEDFETVDGAELFFPDLEDSPTLNEVEEWKERFQGKLFMTRIGDDMYIFRPIRRTEYKNIFKVPNTDQYYKEEKVCEACVLYPRNYGFAVTANGPAGAPTMLFEMILSESGFNPNVQSMRI